MPVARDRMDGNERFRSILTNGNPKVLGTLLAELGDAEAKQVIDECYRDENDTALIHCVRKAGDGKNKKDKDLIDCCLLLLQHGADALEFDDAGKTALHWACENRNETLVKKLMTSHGDPWVKDTKGRNCLLLAVLSDGVDCVNIILNEGSDVKKDLNDTDKDGLSPIIAAVQKGNPDILSALVTSGANVNIQEVNTKRTPLHYALYIKRRDLFEYLLEHGASITLTDHRGTNILHRCCAVDESSFLQHVLLKHDKAQVKKAFKMEDGEGASPVIVACQNGNIQQLQLLAEAEAPLTSRDKFKRCALHHCVENTNTECAELLLQAAPTLVQAADEEGLTPLHMAVIAGNAPLIQLMLKKGANLGAVDNEKHSVTHWATVCGHTSVLNVLLEAGAKLSTPDKYSAYPIHYASQMVAGRGSDGERNSSSGSEGGSIQILKTLLKHDVSTEVEDKDKRTPIIWAASAGNSEACRVLKEHRANVNHADKDDLTALHCAASRGHNDCVGSLVRHCKVRIDPVDKNHCTPLFYAATLGHLNTIRTLLEYEADVTHRDTRGRTVAHCATVSGSTDVLEILKDNKVNLWARNSKGDQPLHEAAQSGHIDIVQYLLSQGSETSSSNNINSSNHDGRTCLHIAALTNNVWLCNVLLEKGANVNIVMSNKGKYYTPYDAALIKGHTETKDILRNHGGVPGTQVSNHAAATIQSKYKYHKKKKGVKKGNEEGEGEEEESEEEGKEKEEDEAAEDKHLKPGEEKVTEDKEKESRGESSDKPNKAKVEKASPVVLAAAVEKSEKENKSKKGEKKSPEKDKPVYVERSTQVATVAPGVLAGDTTEDEPSEKEERRSRPSSKKSISASVKSSKSNSENSKKQQDKKSQKTDHIKSKPPPLVINTGANDKSSDEEDEEEELTSERSSHRNSCTSSHGNSSDVESLDRVVVHKRSKLSSISSSKSKHKNGEAPDNHSRSSVDKEDTKSTTPNATKSNSKSNSKSTKSSPDKDNKKEFASSKSTKSLHKQSSSDSVHDSSGTKRTTDSESGGSNRKELDTYNKKSDSSGDAKATRPSDSDRSRPSDSDRSKPSDSDRTSPRKSDRSAESDLDSPRKSEKSSSFSSDKDNNMGSLFSKRKVAALNNNACKDKGVSNQENGEIKKKINDGYTDHEDSDDGQEMETPRRKKTRPSKLISRIQESVKRYEDERRSIRRLHQIKRAQIYSAPMYDVTLFKAIMENSQNSSQGTPSSNAGNWDEYLQEQIRIIQEDRKAARRNVSGRDTSCDNNTSSRSSDPKSPNVAKNDRQRLSDRDHPSEDNSRATRTDRTSSLTRSNTQGVESPMTRTKSSLNKTSPGLMGRQGRPERAQTAHVSRAQTSKSMTRNDDLLKLKHEEQQRLLRQAYRPFGTINGLSNHQRQLNSLNPRPVTAAGNLKGTGVSGTSSKTGSTCGSIASARQQQRAKGYTVMTPYGSRKYRESMDNSRIADNSMSTTRKRHPLVFQDPDEFDRNQKNNNKPNAKTEEEENR